MSESNLVDLFNGRLLLRALDDLHTIAEASAQLPAMVEQLNLGLEATREGAAATREMIELAQTVVDGATASAQALAQVTGPLVGAAEQFARLVERLPRLGSSRISA